ncbi:MAG: RNA-binding transcriptional accessory protein [Ruminococcaceae bacterium]|nr:RNA-binding transcriptional accessory protein [Oscillospiraceae bacterium]
MALSIFETLAKELSLTVPQVEKTVALMDEGNTIPFISRYRKEVTGSLDDTQLRKLEERLKYLRNIEARRTEVKNLIAAQEKLTPEIEKAIDNALTITEIDDIYRPFRPKRKTRASVAREKGLEPLAEALMAQAPDYTPSLDELAASLVDAEKGVNTPEEAFAGAMDIIAEDISDNAEYRKGIRALTVAHGVIETKKAKDEPSVYEQYYEHSEPIKKLPSHRVLAINRGEKEEFLKVAITVPTDIVLNYLFSLVVKAEASPAKKYVAAAVTDSYERLIAPSVEREIRNDLFDTASEGAIVLFSDNLQHLLMQAPIKGKTVLGFDPGYAHGCKLAVCDKTGKVLDTAVIYLHRENQAKDIMKRLITRWGVDVVAIGNGTASRESEKFVASLLRDMNVKTKYIIVSESGASVYSASKLAAEEFPEFDVMQRSAVSIARRLQDPLAELVKIDPKAIGVGQYQHDMKPARLDEALSGVVEDCVNRVGVDLNTASHSLLSYISGINAVSAKNIVKYREENGEFESRAEVLKVPRIGAKAYEQCAGFLRVPGSDEVLDNTGVHPESYAAARALLAHFGYTEEDVRAGKLTGLSKQVAKEGTKQLAAALGVGEPTLVDIAAELEKPGRDLRDDFAPPLLSEDVLEMTDLKPGQILSGTVRNVIDFGAFVDIGVHQDGLVHISELSDKFVKHPRDVVSVGDIVRVRVLSVDVAKKRIALSMKTMKNEG